MVRNVLGSVLALVGAAAAVWSPFRAWYDGRQGREFRIEDLFDGISGTKAELLGSVFLPMAFAALLTLVGIVLRSRLLVALAGLVVLGFTILWMVRQGQAAGSLTVGDNPDQDLGIGVACALGGGAVLWLAALVMSGRRGVRSRRRDARFDDEGRDRYDGPETFVNTGPEWEPGPIRGGDTPPQGVPAYGAAPRATPHHQPPVRWPGAGHPPPGSAQQPPPDDQSTRPVPAPPAPEDPEQPPPRPDDATRPIRTTPPPEQGQEPDRTRPPDRPQWDKDPRRGEDR
ncbi:hypothetical protein ACH4OW_19360 [Streptomyces sp. NPDC017056]|uniref:hypothetical protein n=1 Tax=Streptomyces sp. NPDC017056 TaxID=3364973 RepID=UPI00379DA884